MPRNVAFQHADKLVARQCTFGIATFIAVTGHDRQNFGNVELKGVPALRAPGFAYSSTFQDDMRDAGMLKSMTNAQPGPARPYDHHVEYVAHHTLQPWTELSSPVLRQIVEGDDGCGLHVADAPEALKRAALLEKLQESAKA